LTQMLRTEAAKRGWTAGNIAMDESQPRPLTTSVSVGEIGSDSPSKKKNATKNARRESLSLTSLPPIDKTVRPSTTGSSTPQRKASGKDLKLGSRPNSSPAGDSGRMEGGAVDSFADDAERRVRTNPFEEFMSDSDLDAVTRKKMLLEDRQQNFHMSDFRHKSTQLKDDLRVKTPDELYENKVLFSKASMSLFEATHKCSYFTQKPLPSREEVRELKVGLKKSHGRMVDELGVLSLLLGVAESGNDKKVRPKTNVFGPRRSRVSMVGRKIAATFSMDDLLDSVRNEEWREFKLIGLTDNDIETVARIFGRFQAKHGKDPTPRTCKLDKAALARSCSKAQKSFSKERFEAMWRTIDGHESHEGITFISLLRWSARCLPIQLSADKA